MPSGFGFGNSLDHVRAVCRERQGIGWYLTAGEGSARYVSGAYPYANPIAILAVSRFSQHSLPAILAQVGWGDTGQPYELFTFSGHRIVPVRMTFLHKGVWSGLAGGGAAFHGQGVFCSARGGQFVITQVDWEGEPGTKRVDITRERWTFSGEPLKQRSVVELLAQHKRMTYKALGALENAHC